MLGKSLPGLDTGDAYSKLCTKVNGYFTVKKHQHHAHYLFVKMRPCTGETISVYAARLREKAIEW